MTARQRAAFVTIEVSARPAHQHYAKITPNTLTRAYTGAGYFARNLRALEVLVDRDAVTSGAAAAGEPWQYYDLGQRSRSTTG